jgi:hypothetical protein
VSAIRVERGSGPWQPEPLTAARFSLARICSHPGWSRGDSRQTLPGCEKSGLNLLAFDRVFSTSSGMALPTEPVTLSVEQIKDLNNQLKSLVHRMIGLSKKSPFLIDAVLETYEVMLVGP